MEWLCPFPIFDSIFPNMCWKPGCRLIAQPGFSTAWRLRQSKAKSFRQLDKMKVIFLLYLMKGFRRYNNHTKCLSSCPAESSLPWYIRISPASSEMVCFEHQLSSTTSVTACFQSRNGSFRTKLPFRSLFPGRPEQGVSPQMPYGHSRSDKPRYHQ